MAVRTTESARAAIAHKGGLINVTGMAQAWEMTRQAVHYRIALPGFPNPIPIEGTDQGVWFAAEVFAWDEEYSNPKESDSMSAT